MQDQDFRRHATNVRNRTLLFYVLFTAIWVVLWHWVLPPSGISREADPLLYIGSRALRAAAFLCVTGVIFFLAMNRVIGRIREVALKIEYDASELENLFESGPQPVFIVEEDTYRFLAANRAALKSFGYNLDELRSMCLPDLVPGDGAGLPFKVDGFFNTRLRRKDGSVRVVEGSGTHVVYTGLRALMVVLSDVTERTRYEASLRENEARYSAIFENNYSVVLIIDRKTMRIVDANPAASRFYGYSRKELKLKKISEINTLPMSDVQREIEKARTGDGSHFYFQHRLASGEVRDVEVYSGPVNVQGRELLYSIVHDISDRTKAERALREREEELRRLNEQLEERVRQRTEQLRSLASQLTLAEQGERRRISQILHDDLQQLLFGLQVRVQMLEIDLKRNVIPAPPDSAEPLSALIDRAIRTTRSLSVDLSPPVLEGEGLNQSFEWLKFQMEDVHGLDLELTIADGCCRVPGKDMRVLIFQLVRELLFNVVKHSGVKKARLDAFEKEGFLTLCVSDEGRGFDVESLAARQSRTGLGLFSVRERLALFGGRLHVDSHPGKGTTATITIPLQDRDYE